LSGPEWCGLGWRWSYPLLSAICFFVHLSPSLPYQEAAPGPRQVRTVHGCDPSRTRCQPLSRRAVATPLAHLAVVPRLRPPSDNAGLRSSGAPRLHLRGCGGPPWCTTAAPRCAVTPPPPHPASGTQAGYSHSIISSLSLPLYFSMSGGLRKRVRGRQASLAVGTGETAARWRRW
jgi:hypothetical protein